MNARIPSGSIALVTGSSSGFGLLSCVELARRGLYVFASMRDLGRSAALDQAMAEAGVSCEKLELDVTRPDSIEAALGQITEKVTGKVTERAARASIPIDILVNNAGFGMAGFVEDFAMNELREQFETNFFGLVAMTKAVIPGMRERRRGRIINVSSMSGRVAHPGFAAYVASKFAVEGFSEALRHELLPYGVYVVLIEPGMFRTEIFEKNARVAERARDPDSPNYEAAKRLEKLVYDRMAQNTADPAAVASVIALAATTDKPRLRYAVGTDAAVMGTLHSVLPFRLWERAVSRVTGRGRRE